MKKSHVNWIKKEQAIDTFMELYKKPKWNITLVFGPDQYQRLHQRLHQQCKDSAKSLKITSSDFILNNVK
jgi:hypothetical protein